MKKLIILLALIFVVASFSGCFLKADTTKDLEDKASEAAADKADEDDDDDDDQADENDADTPEETEEPEISDNLEFDTELVNRQGDVEITVVSVGIYTDEELGYENERQNYIALGVLIENYNTENSFSVYPDQGTIITDTGEMIESDFFNSDFIGGEILPEVIIDGVIIFPLTYTMPNEVASFTYYVDAPYDKDYTDVGEQFVFEIAVEMPNYQPVSREEILNRINQRMIEEASDTAVYTMMYQTDASIQTGSITITVPCVAMINDYKGFEDEPYDYIIVFMVVENSAQEAITFTTYSTVMTTDTKEQLDTDMWLGTYIDSEFYADVFKTGSLSFVLGRSDIEEVHEIKLNFGAPYDANYNDAGEDITLIIPLN